MNSILFIMLIILPVCLTKNSPSIISIPVTAFEYDLFRWPHATSECDSFLHEMGLGSINLDSQDSLRNDCERFQRALACYNSFYSSLNMNTKNGRQTKKDLDEHDLAHIKSQCIHI